MPTRLNKETINFIHRSIEKGKNYYMHQNLYKKNRDQLRGLNVEMYGNGFIILSKKNQQREVFNDD